MLADILYSSGSSPRVWGQGSGVMLSPILSGIIPTRVGTSNNTILVALAPEDHPHACGDKVRCLQKAKLRIGSSPRVWGQENYSPERAETTGIIPTRVGTSLFI